MISTFDPILIPSPDLVEELVCDYAGHEWVDAGGGLAICGMCQAEEWWDNIA